MKKIYAVFLVLVSFCLCACSEKFDTSNESDISEENVVTDTESGDESDDEENDSNILSHQVHYYADITHDGVDDDICIDYEKIINDSQAPASINVVANDKCIWNAELGLPHAGWGEYYLVMTDNEYYLLLNMPEESQGIYADYYKLFYISAEGTEIIVDEMSVFDVDESKQTETIEEYYNNVNKYIENGQLLISTWEGELK